MTDVSGQTKHAVPIVQVEAARKEKPPALTLQGPNARGADGGGGPAMIPPLPSLPSPTPPADTKKSRVNCSLLLF